MLEPDLVNRIAAGEVVERPASVVKELIENAVDAESSRVDVVLRDSGIGEITVRDDGHGMSRDEALLALVRHATSKLASDADLYRIGTYGFRGEALPAIASVSRLRLTSRRAEDDEGTEVVVEDGADPTARPAGAPVGTTVSVRDLFHRTPARRKFLKSPRTELAACVRTVETMALGAPAVGFTVHHEGRMLRRFLPQRRAADRVREVLADVPLHEVSGALEGLEVLAFLAPPGEARGGARPLDILVNGRSVTDRSVVAAVIAAYEGMVERGRIPPGVVYLNLAPDAVDVNVHPRKSEVRFLSPRQIYSALLHLLRAGLAKAPWSVVPSPPPPWTPGIGEWSGGEAAFGAHGRSPPFSLTPAVVRPAQPLQQPLGQTRAGWSAPQAWVRAGAAGPRFSRLEPAGQVFLTYLICEGDDAVVLIDQHAAHERVVFEDLREAIRGGALPSQTLLAPVQVALDAELLAVLGDEREALERLGFDAEVFGTDRAALRAHPAGLRGDPASALREALEALRHGPGSERSALDVALATVACHSAIRAGRRLSDPEIRALLGRMDEVDFEAYCPHGRPAWTVITRGELERMFSRR